MDKEPDIPISTVIGAYVPRLRDPGMRPPAQPPRLHGPGTQPRDRQPLIAAAAIDQDDALESLWQAIQLLEDRLQPVLAPVFPQAQGTQGTADDGRIRVATLPPLAEQLQLATRKIQAAEFKIRELADRVEV